METHTNPSIINTYISYTYTKINKNKTPVGTFNLKPCVKNKLNT